MPSKLEPSPEGLLIGPVFVSMRTKAQALKEIKEAICTRKGVSVAFANTHLIHAALRDPGYAKTLASFLVLNDGVGLSALAQIAAGRRFHDNLNGTDFVPRVLACAPVGVRVFLVGASREVASAAAANWARDFPHLDIVGVTDGYRGAHIGSVSAQIIASAADIVLVAMGNPRQEQWIELCRARAPGAAYFGVGALFNYTSGAAQRAPPLVRAARAEWLYRLGREPGRLWRRYTIEMLVVFAHVFSARFFRAGPVR